MDDRQNPGALDLDGPEGARVEPECTHLYACKATVDMFGLTMDDFVPQVEEIISVGVSMRRRQGDRSSSRNGTLTPAPVARRQRR